MTQIHASPATVQTDLDFHRGSAAEERSLSWLLEQTLAANENNTEGSLSSLIDQLISKSVRTVLDSILSRTKTQQAEELQTFERIVNVLMNKHQIDRDNENLMIWLIGHLSAQLDMLALFDDDLELDADVRLLGVVNSYRHASDILSILYNQPQLSQGELAHALGLSPSALSNALERMKEYQLVFADKHGQKKYYTLSANGQKIQKYLKLRDCSMTPDRLAVHIEKMLTNFRKVLQGKISSDEAVSDFRPFAQQCTSKSQVLEHLLRETLDSVPTEKVSTFIIPFVKQQKDNRLRKEDFLKVTPDVPFQLGCKSLGTLQKLQSSLLRYQREVGNNVDLIPDKYDSPSSPVSISEIRPVLKRNWFEEQLLMPHRRNTLEAIDLNLKRG